MSLIRPSATFMERVSLPLRAPAPRSLPSQPESGLDSVFGVLAPALLSAVTGIHGLGESIDTGRHLTATRASQVDMGVPGKEKIPTTPEITQSAPTPSLSITAPAEITLIDVPHVRNEDLLDPRLKATDPEIASKYQPRPSTMSAAVGKFASSKKDVGMAEAIKESVPWRMRH